jgi:hypothetical protein
LFGSAAGAATSCSMCRICYTLLGMHTMTWSPQHVGKIRAMGHPLGHRSVHVVWTCADSCSDRHLSSASFYACNPVCLPACLSASVPAIAD